MTTTYRAAGSTRPAPTTSSTNPPASAAAPRTRALLACGVAAGPVFLVVALTQAFTRAGFDLRRHPFSMLSLGDLGWLQVTNFVATGALFTACAIGMRRAAHPDRGGTWGPITIGLFGLAQIAGGVFVADPALGFPVGAAEGPPESISLPGMLHGVAFAVGMTSLIAAIWVLARRFAAAGDRAFATYSAATGVAFIVLGGLGFALDDWRIVALAVVLGWGWASLAAARIRTELTTR